MTIEQLIQKIKTDPETVNFQQVMKTIEENYEYKPARFRNGTESDHIINEEGTNEGSCKIFSFGQLNQLNEHETLACFGAYYRDDVLQNSNGTDHANIRLFMIHGWSGIKFGSPALVARN